MLTLVAVVLVYDMAREMCEARSSPLSAPVDMEGAGRRALLPSRSERSWTRLEKDMVASFSLSCRNGPQWVEASACEVKQKNRSDNRSRNSHGCACKVAVNVDDNIPE